jgi:hypothetical protein
MNLFERIRRVFLALPALAQWIVITLGKSLIASMLISFLATYATAIFATRHGFRVPIEGVPFLHLAIAFVTFITFAGTIILFSLLMLLFRELKRQIDMYFDYLRIATMPLPRNWARRLLNETRSTLSFILSSVAMLVLSAMCLLACIWILLAADSVMEILPNMLQPNSRRPLDLAFVFACCSVVFVALWCVESNLNWIAAQIFASGIIITLMAFALFVNDAYGSFLRIVRYGGGIAATVRYVEGDNKTPLLMSGNLLILTTTHAMLFDPGKSRIMEIALRNVSTIEYDIAPSWQLPGYELRRQKDFIDFDVSKVRP